MATASSTFPAVGHTQCCCGQDNGIWRTWMVHDGVIGKQHSWTDRAQAFGVHDANIEVLKFKMRGER